jgi:hypothetical protein
MSRHDSNAFIDRGAVADEDEDVPGPFARQSPVGHGPGSVRALHRIDLARHGHRFQRKNAFFELFREYLELGFVQGPIPFDGLAGICRHAAHDGGQGGLCHLPAFIQWLAVANALALATGARPCPWPRPDSPASPS